MKKPTTKPKPARKKADTLARYGIKDIWGRGFVVWDWVKDEAVHDYGHLCDAQAHAKELNAANDKALARKKGK